MAEVSASQNTKAPANRPDPCHGERWWSTCWYFMGDGPWYAVCEQRHRVEGNDPNYQAHDPNSKEEG